eukprot:9498225-Pyramimonas_sp.AAC.1
MEGSKAADAEERSLPNVARAVAAQVRGLAGDSFRDVDEQLDELAAAIGEALDCAEERPSREGRPITDGSEDARIAEGQ